MVNQLAKFSPLVSEMTHPLRQLLSMKTDWTWNPMLEEAFLNIKTALSKTTVLTAYNTAAELKVSADASSHSLGAALLQRQSSSHWQPVCYASRSMTSAEVNYAQIEKEALALTWACERFGDYVLGKSILIETDHKLLVSKSTFARYGIPQTLRSDDGPQFDSKEMSSFAESYGFVHDTSSP